MVVYVVVFCITPFELHKFSLQCSGLWVYWSFNGGRSV